MILRRSIIFAIACLSGAPGCSKAPEPPAAPERLSAVFSGCADWLEDGTCTLDQGAALTAWIPASSEAKVRVQSGTVAVAFEDFPAGAGRRLIFRPGGRETVELSVSTATIARAMSLQLAKSSTTGEAREKYQAGRQAFKAGDAAKAIALLDEARTLARAPSLALRAALLASFILVINQGDLAGAEVRLSAVGEPPAHDGEGRALYYYHLGSFSRKSGDYRSAIRALEVAARSAVELALPLRPLISNLQAGVLLDLGRIDEAIAVYSALEKDAIIAANPCFSADAVQNLGWALLVRGSAGERDDIETMFHKARENYRGPCKDVERENHTSVNLALFFLERHQPERALGVLAEISGKERPDAHAWRIALEARAALELGRFAEAARAYEELRRQAVLGSFVDLEWAAAVGAGKIFEAQRNAASAIANYREAENILDRGSALVPVDRGRIFYFSKHGESAERLVSALLGAGRITEAFDARRRAQRRALTALSLSSVREHLSGEERAAFYREYTRYRNAREALESALADAWRESRADASRADAARAMLRRQSLDALDDVIASLPARARERLREEKLATPGEDELYAGVYRSEVGLEVYLRTAKTVRVERVRSIAEAEKILTAPDRSAPDRSAPHRQKMIVFTSEPELAPHTTAHADVVYALDLPKNTAPAANNKAAVVADPRGDLAGARAEGEEIARLIERSGVAVERYFGARATFAELTAAFREVDLLHYAGHAETRGLEGWETALLVADGRVEVGDIITSARLPPRVVLIGCETGVGRDAGAARGVTLAASFLLGGSEMVIATSEKIDDATARAWSNALYAGATSEPSLLAAYRRALENTRSEDARAFRVYVR